MGLYNAAMSKLVYRQVEISLTLQTTHKGLYEHLECMSLSYIRLGFRKHLNKLVIHLLARWFFPVVRMTDNSHSHLPIYILRHAQCVSFK